MLSVDTRGGAIALFVVALLLLGALLRHGDQARDALHKRVFLTFSARRTAPGEHTRKTSSAQGLGVPFST